MSHDEPSTTRARRERSTRYPGVPLSDCVELGKFIESRGLDGLTAPDIASALGYKNIKTNTFSARLSAARQFGLLALRDEGYSLTPLAKSILHPVDPTDLPRLYRQALLEPPIYADLVERLAEKRVPDVTILGNVLYHSHHIIASAKDAAAEAFIASARFAGALADDLVLRVAQNGPTSSATPPAAPVVVTPVPDPPSSAPPGPRTHPSEARIDLRLWGDDAGKLIRVRAPESITAESYDRLLQALRLHVRIDGEA